MNDNGNHQGVYKHRTTIPMDNPEIKKDHDWWDDLCKAHGAKNLWKKRKASSKKVLPKKASKKAPKKR